jgi:hypothetical protein
MNNNINEILENEKQHNQKEPWLKLNKTIKIEKFKNFVDIFSKENELDDIQKNDLLSFLCSCLDKKKLLKSKEVNYDKDQGLILSIPNLTSINKKFTLKRCEKRQSTLKSLPSKKINKQLKIKNEEIEKNHT